jgi:3',5'-cyclic AMP phosphodiesterase CpdA
MSDLHLESQEFPWALPKGDVLIIAGDLCHAACLDPARKDPYAVKQRERVLRFAEDAVAKFAHVLLIAGNHDHYDGVFEDTVPTLRRYLPGFTVLDDESVAIDGVHFFGTTLWSDFEGENEAAMMRARKGAGEFFFVKTRAADAGTGKLPKFQPADALRAHKKALNALQWHIAATKGSTTVVISHHAPSRKGLNPLHMGNGLDGAYASDLDDLVASLEQVPVWVHGHTHIKKTYRIGGTVLRANCRGFDGRDPVAHTFSVKERFNL